MAIIPDVPHPIQRDGRSQNQRLVKALSPPASAEEARRNDSAMVDENTLADLLDFILRFARQVKFQTLKLKGSNGQYQQNGNRVSGKTAFDESLQEEDLITQSDWATLFRQDPVFVIAAISKTDTSVILAEFETQAAEAGRFDQFEGVHLLFDLCISALFQIHNWYTALQQEPVYLSNDLNGKPNQKTGLSAEKQYRPFVQTIQDIISTNLLGTATRLITYSNAAKEHWGYQPYRSFEELKFWSLGDLAQKDTILIEVKGSIRTKVKNAVHQLGIIFSELFGSLQEIVSQAATALHEAIENKSHHQPHIGLIIAFTRLLEKARTNPDDLTDSYLNAATKKHLDFFYKEVLNLTTNLAKPDQAHLVFELAKELNEVKLDKNTAYLGGKDTNGAPIVFKLDDEIIVTKAQVADLRTLYLKKKYREKLNGVDYRDIVEDVFFAPIANSADGLGGDFPKGTLAAWKTLGWEEGKVPMVVENNLLVKQFHPNPKARIGLIVASKVLHLESGKREITFEMDCKVAEALKTDYSTYVDEFKKALNTRYEITAEVVAEIKKLGMQSLAESLKDYIKSDSLYDVEALFEDIITKMKNLGIHPSENEKNAYSSILNRLIKRHHGFDIMLSGEKEWLKPYDVKIDSNPVKQQTNFKITISIILDPDFPAITWYNPKVLGEQIDTTVPAIRLELRQEQHVTEEISLYHFFRYTQSKNISISTNVTGFQGFLLQTDEGIQDARKAFNPFGALPKIGSSFYIGSSEIFRKRWIGISLNLIWKDKPKNFKEYYANYRKEGIDESEFKVGIHALSQRNWKQVELDPIPCSTLPKNAITNALLNQGLESSTLRFINTTANIPNEDPTQLEPLTVFSNEGFVRFSLQGEDFQHDSFAQVFSRQAQAQALFNLDKKQFINGAIYSEPADNSNRIYKIYPDDYKGEPSKLAIVELPNAPYTPVIDSISLDYCANSEIGDLHIYHLYPSSNAFKKVQLFEEMPAVSILPEFEDEGTLFLGISDLKPGQNLDILFQVAESTADPDLMPAEVKWSYLSSNVWKSLKQDVDILSDETEGFLRSGVIKIAVPFDIDQNNTILPSTLHWLKASVYQRAGATSETIAVRAQAARATFAPEAISDTNRLISPLPAESIAKALVANAAIKQISQPYPSFGGRPAESMPNFYRRVSEHLRHKGRAITLFDYERLVLEYFPEIFKIKCITHSLGLSNEVRDFHVAPGHVIVAIIPDLSKLEFADRFQPKATRNLLDRVEDFLKLRTSTFVQVRALNPRYQLFRVTGNIRFAKGKSADFYKKQLQKDLDQFLAPWAFGERDKIDFGGVVYKSVILKFIESLEYVEYITNFLLLRKKEIQLGKHVAPAPPDTFQIGGRLFSPLEIQSIHEGLISTTKLIPSAKFLEDDYQAVDKIVADTARSILVAEQHVFEVIDKECCQPNSNFQDMNSMKGLGYMPIHNGDSCDTLVKGTREPRCDCDKKDQVGS